MKSEMFKISTWCTIHQIEYAFVDSLKSEGLISITSNEDGEFIEEEQLHTLEIYKRLHHELDINAAGIDAIRHLLNKIQGMQEEINELRNRLRFYEG